jgi:hypothetical protein
MGTETGTIMASPGGGDSAIFGPTGERLTEATEATTETILYADLDMNKLVEARMFADSMGHYSRPDLFRLSVYDEERSLVNYRANRDGEIDGGQTLSASPAVRLPPYDSGSVVCHRGCSP